VYALRRLPAIFIAGSVEARCDCPGYRDASNLPAIFIAGSVEACGRTSAKRTAFAALPAIFIAGSVEATGSRTF